MNNSEHSCTFFPLWMITDHVAPQLSWLTKWLTTFWASVVLHSCAFSESQPHQMTYCIGHNCMLFLCCEWLRLCISSHLLLDWMIEHLCILPPLRAYVSQIGGLASPIDIYSWMDRIFFIDICAWGYKYLCDICAYKEGGGVHFHHLNIGRSIIPIVEVWCNK